MAGYRKLGLSTDQRRAMLRSLVTSFLKHGRIETTETRAKEARSIAEKMITLAKRGDLHARRQVLAYVLEEDVVKTLFDEIAPKYFSYKKILIKYLFLSQYNKYNILIEILVISKSLYIIKLWKFIWNLYNLVIYKNF